MTDKFGWSNKDAEATPFIEDATTLVPEEVLTDIIQTEDDVGIADETLPVEEVKEEHNLPM